MDGKQIYKLRCDVFLSVFQLLDLFFIIILANNMTTVIRRRAVTAMRMRRMFTNVTIHNHLHDRISFIVFHVSSWGAIITSTLHYILWKNI